MKISRFDLIMFTIIFVASFGLITITAFVESSFDFWLVLVISFGVAIFSVIWGTISHKRIEKKIEKMREKMD